MEKCGYCVAGGCFTGHTTEFGQLPPGACRRATLATEGRRSRLGTVILRFHRVSAVQVVICVQEAQ